VSVRLDLVLPGEAAVRVRAADASSLPRTVATPAGERALRLEGLTPEGGLSACLGCAHPELFTQKDFPRALGLGVVVAAALLAPFTWYASLAVAALLDAVLYRTAPDALVCYVCRSRHRGFAARPRHPRFDREIDERLRYGERAVMGKPMRPGGTADAPEPEH
jgi:hypothetical protein